MTIRSALIVLLLVGVCTIAHAEVKLPAIFGEHMVLQRDAAVPVWNSRPG